VASRLYRLPSLHIYFIMSFERDFWKVVECFGKEFEKGVRQYTTQ
jgi:hypothetical protein